MKVSTRTRYAARALAELAIVYPHGTASLQSVADSQGISAKYLESIFNTLRTRGLIRTVRGPRGGYALAVPPESITLRQVCETLDGPVCPVGCVNFPDACPRIDSCPTRDTWVEVREAIVGVLERTTIRAIVARRTQEERASPFMYHI